jgi:hypothetical protein
MDGKVDPHPSLRLSLVSPFVELLLVSHHAPQIRSQLLRLQTRVGIYS